MEIAEMTMVEMTAPSSSKVGSMGVSLFEGPTPVESFLFSKLDRWGHSEVNPAELQLEAKTGLSWYFMTQKVG